MVDPQLPAARKKFPDVAPLAFPTREHEWGVQNAYIQAAADLGLIGLVLWLAPFALALLLGLCAPMPHRERWPPSRFCRRWASGADRASWPEFPLDAVTWLGFGLAATAAAQRSQAPPQGKWQG